MNQRVALLSCPDYDTQSLTARIAEAWELSGGPDLRGKSVLLKPNLIKGAEPGMAVSTHPEILRAAITLCRRQGAGRIVVGDSPGYQSFQAAASQSGLLQVIKEEGVEFDDFSSSVQLSLAEGRLVKSFKIAKAAADAEILISLPKLKTHSLLQYTGALKNLFGLVCGFDKAAYHFRFPDSENFAGMLVDLFLLAKPDYAIMDAVVAMEGPGPGSGYPRPMGCILASENSLALDRTACRLIGYDPDKIGYLAEALKRGPWLSDGQDAVVVGDPLARFMVSDFKLIRTPHSVDFARRAPGFLRPALRRFLIKRPSFNHSRCLRCSGCLNICPVKALSYSLGSAKHKRVIIDYKRCIRCYCCHEVCPADAIRLRRF